MTDSVRAMYDSLRAQGIDVRIDGNGSLVSSAFQPRARWGPEDWTLDIAGTLLIVLAIGYLVMRAREA